MQLFGKQTANGDKPTGMEMMMQSLLKTMGVDNTMLTGYIETGKSLAQQFVDAMKTMNEHLSAIREEQAAQRTLIETHIRNSPCRYTTGDTNNGTGNGS